MSNQQYIEGRNPVLEGIKGQREIEKILIAEGANQGSIKKIKGMAKDNNIMIQYVHRNKLDSLSETGNHQGVMALVTSYEYKDIEDIFALAEERDEHPFVIILDEIEDPHNLGSIIRTAECAGAHGIIIPKRRSASVTAVVSKTSAGAVEYMPVVKVSNIAYTMDQLKDKGLWIYGADMDGKEDYFDVDIKGPVGIVVGNEGKGIGRLVKEKCDFLIKIPMKGKVTSLNASVSASIIMYEVLRQRSLR
ncbi:23S rRNA (guanosine(2251)-2'-O)-methyltransferase RlmB [Clostridiisalibacter paucivorans]|uniref:23S rRNA (guanosine(2251)-2'-O)-methyltransferase RlmB n=1 Tax=Clostridiisalibacter paucivorans TaxID=408753 RepID=UPI00047CFA11|nr:23S rRNA (guanosine(2251)-2'-O)-methyltransferase RlmB [Clostridiisalibacter paucivorans]